MSGQHEVPVDPLAALRAADHRPLAVVWRERLATAATTHARAVAQRGSVVVVVGLLAVALVWRLYVTAEPPVEASIPFADPTSPTVVPSIAPPAALPAESVEPAEPAEAAIVMHVAGAVRRPGLVAGTTGWRVDDAIRAAGGALGSADLDRLNLAQFVNDGERIFVPEVGEDEPTVLLATGGAGGTAQATSGPVNLNTADAVQLETLPGVGPATAAAIMAHREEHGSFGTVDALVAVRGIGPTTLEALRDHVTIG